MSDLIHENSTWNHISKRRKNLSQVYIAILNLGNVWLFQFTDETASLPGRWYMNKLAPSGPSGCLGMDSATTEAAASGIWMGWATPIEGIRFWWVVKYLPVGGIEVNCCARTVAVGVLIDWFVLYNCDAELIDALDVADGEPQNVLRSGLERFIWSVTPANCCWRAKAATAANWWCCCCCWAAAVAIVAKVVRYGFVDMASCWGDKLVILEDIAADGDDQIREMMSRLCLLTSFSFWESANFTTSGDEQPWKENNPMKGSNSGIELPE